MKLFLLVALVGCVYAETQECPVEEVDDKVYLFGYGYSFGPYEFLNDDGELMGLGYDITRSVCRVMKKKCEHAVFYDYSYGWNDKSASISLNDGWYHAIVNWVPTPHRVSSYAFFGEIAKEPASYMYVRRGNNMDTVQEIRNNANRFGFRTGFRTDNKCLEKYLGISLNGKSHFYANGAELESALRNREVDVIFMDSIEILDSDDVDRVGNEPIRCALGGISCMTRKNKAYMFSWYDEGLKKIKANGDYEWLCNINSNDADVGCFD